MWNLSIIISLVLPGSTTESMGFWMPRPELRGFQARIRCSGALVPSAQHNQLIGRVHLYRIQRRIGSSFSEQATCCCFPHPLMVLHFVPVPIQFHLKPLLCNVTVFANQDYVGYCIHPANIRDFSKLTLQKELWNITPSSVVYWRDIVFYPWTICGRVLYFCRCRTSRRKETTSTRGPRKQTKWTSITCMKMFPCFPFHLSTVERSQLRQQLGITTIIAIVITTLDFQQLESKIWTPTTIIFRQEKQKEVALDSIAASEP